MTNSPTETTMETTEKHPEAPERAVGLQRLVLLLKPGTVLRVWYNPNNINNRLWHVRAVVDDEQVVCRLWNKRKQRWDYRVEWIGFFQMLAENENLFEA